jgi:DNA-binding FadR family transcriptional regulator
MRDFVRTALDVSIRFTSPASHDFDVAIAAHASVFQAISAGNAKRARGFMQKLIADAYTLL